MNPIEAFQDERHERISGYACDAQFNSLSQLWLRESMQRSYVYNFDWLGRPIIQYPQDIVAVQELIWSTRPDVIVETGIAHGGSLILSASILALLDYADAVEQGQVLDPSKPKRHVVGVDVDIRAHNRAAIESHALASRVTMIEGSSVAEGTVREVRDVVGNAERVLVFLDSMHTHEHVLKELFAYGPMVTKGSYVVVFDTFVEDMPKGFFENRPWDVANNPKTAVHEFVQNESGFEIDAALANKLQVTVAPDGFLKRVR